MVVNVPAPTHTPTVAASAAPPEVVEIPVGGICIHTEEGTCDEFKSSALGLSQGFCEAGGGKYLKDTACSRENLLGTCVKEGGDKHMFYDGNGRNMTAEDARHDCESNDVSRGKWTQGPAAASSKVRRAPHPSKILSSCDRIDDASSCDDHSVPDSFDRSKSTCEDMKGKYEKKACPSAMLVGSCVYPTGRTARYYLPKKGTRLTWTVAELEKDCEMEMHGQKGVWIGRP